MINLLDSDHLKKQRIALISFLRGARMYSALAVLNFAENVHSGMRKDGVTPEFAHQIQIALFISTLNMKDEALEVAIIAALAHDLFEDYPKITIESMQKKMKTTEVLIKGLEAALTLSKIRDGVKLDFIKYLEGISQNPIAALCKGVDRMNNFQTMSGVFSEEKQKKYIEEGLLILNAVKQARKRHPEFSSAFLNVEHILKSQVELISIMLNIHPTRKIAPSASNKF